MADISRRDFLKKGSAALAGMIATPTILQASVLNDLAEKKKKTGKKPGDGKLNILGVGIGGRGAANLAAMETENIIGLCDCDWKYAKHVFEKYPQAKAYSDYRKMFDELLDKADAVMIATADHTHAVIAAEAIAAGKHVYLEKPMTLYAYESRLLTKLAEKYKVATQQGNQGASSEGTRKALNWLWNGEIGEVTRIEAFTNRPIWPQGMAAPTDKPAIPSTMNWDAFIGPAKYRDYHPSYTPWNFRGWWDFGSGALGDMANHILQVAFKGLHLANPTDVIGSSTMLMTDACPTAQKITFRFPARPNLPRLALPECELTWYDGGLRPNLPFNIPAGKKFDGDGATVFYGTKDIMVVGTYGTDPILVSGRKPEVPHLLREVTLSHQQDWIRACKEDPDSRIPSNSDFSEAGPFVEMVDVGVAAVRLQTLNQVLDYDSEKMEFTNIPADATIRILEKDGFSIHDGHPTFQNKYTDPVNAREFAAHLLKREYQNGYSLPAMPTDV